jgi:hypothetical protein
VSARAVSQQLGIATPATSTLGYVRRGLPLDLRHAAMLCTGLYWDSRSNMITRMVASSSYLRCYQAQ